MVVVREEELVPAFFNCYDSLQKTIKRYESKSYGIKRVQKGGNGRLMYVLYDSLPADIKNSLGDPRKVTHILEKYYKNASETITFYSTYQFEDGTYIKTEYQEQYIINASVIIALLRLKQERVSGRRTMGMSLTGITKTLLSDAILFQQTLKVKHKVEHTLPESEKRFKQALKDFEKEGYESQISGKHGNNNSRKVTDPVLALLESMFAKDKTKPTATAVKKEYDKFLKGWLEVINNDTAEVYDPKDYPELSRITVTNYLANWSSRIGTHAHRSGDRQMYMQQYKPYHSLKKPEFAGSIISVDDRQPPFKSTEGKRIWFYNAIDLGSEAFTCWVYGKTKEGIIIDFYRQLVRNYAEWKLNLPAELEAEMSLNASFTNTFLREGVMFEHVRIEANNARGKRIEAYYKPLRYDLEKKRIGWLARPHALTESNQPGSEKVPELPYRDIVEGCLQDIEDWNNTPHSKHQHLTRWDVFMQMQNPNLNPTNYLAIIPHVGFKTCTSCRVGEIKLQSQEFLLGNKGQVATGEALIILMKQVEGEQVDVYWLDGNDHKILKAFVFIGSKYICEAVSKPKYNRAKKEQTADDLANREIMSKYVATIEAYGRSKKRAIEGVTIIDNTPARPKSFVMPGLKKQAEIKEWAEPEILPDMPENEIFGTVPEEGFVPKMYSRY